ncbi:hypothetical protein PPROV_000874000 [Pycnococcus provasolii]|uniref:Uncharacterized protein n=1 Tax=Pycnococcus provasolii TaxID=41880 RepID=A0A830HYH2_9CHLO|nr:hypothetical protein PPROV_000874000 [Pycnococcus provasolii]
MAPLKGVSLSLPRTSSGASSTIGESGGGGFGESAPPPPLHSQPSQHHNLVLMGLGEVAANLLAFDKEFEKFLRTACPDAAAKERTPCTWKQSKKLAELFEHYAARLPPQTRAPRWLDAADV